MNTLKTTFLMALLTVLLVTLGGALGGRGGMGIALMMAAGMNFFYYWFSDKMVLSMYGAQEITEVADPRYYGMFLMAILAPIAAMLVQMAISRSREFGADAGGASISGSPLSLANALQKLEMGNQQIPMQANAATAHMFIINPLAGGGLMSFFSTHPPMAERVARLQEIARTHSY
jgi:Zn-dependent protease with chaperone function